MSEISTAKVIWKALDDAANASPHRRMYAYQGQEISFQQVNERANRVVEGLFNLGFAKGDRIGIIGFNQPEWLYQFYRPPT